MSAIYAKCTRVGRRDLWQAIEEVKGWLSGPWLVAGDFNVVSNTSEQSGGPRQTGAIWKNLMRPFLLVSFRMLALMAAFHLD